MHPGSTIFDEEKIAYQAGKTLNGVFHIISVGLSSEVQLVIDAWNSDQDSHIILRMDWRGPLNSQDARALVDKVTLKTIGTNKILVFQ
jgi:hypothetical protein